MKYTLAFAISLLALLLTNCSSPSEKVAVVDLVLMETRLDSLLQATVADGKTPGVAVAIVSASDVLYSSASGVSNVETAKTLKTTDVFNFTSIVKTFTATAIMQQVDKGAMELDNSASIYWKTPFAGLELATLRHMLSHSSGLQFTEQAPATDGTLAAGDLKLVNIPGYTLQYSNAAFYSLGQLVAHQHEMGFPDYVSSNILSPLGMESTSVISPPATANMATGHTLQEDALVIVDMSMQAAPRKVGNGILYSTIEDMAIWAQMHLNRGTYGDVELLKKSSYTQIWNANLPTGWDDMKAAAGLGCFIGTVADEPSVSHIGGGNGYSAAFVLLPGADRGIVIVGNSDKLPREALIAAIAEVLLK